MALEPQYLADKSAITRFRNPLVVDRYGDFLAQGRVASCPIVDLEVLYSARSLKDYEDTSHERRSLPTYPVTPETTDRALEVQHLLATKGRHRLPIPDLLVAAVAELNDLTVLHYDADYDRIAEVTGQRTEWVAARGSL